MAAEPRSVCVYCASSDACDGAYHDAARTLGGLLAAAGAVERLMTINVNGQPETRDVEPRTLLVQFLREHLQLTGTHVGCDTSQCGACTVLIDGRAVKSCTVLAVQCEGEAITTIEGIGTADSLHPIQSAFWEKHGLQCGFCTPGMIMTAVDFLASNPDPSEAEIRHALEGNYCRCTGYQAIVDAIEEAIHG